MALSLFFIRILFFVLSLFFMTAYMVTTRGGASWEHIGIGLLLGTALAGTLIGLDVFFRRFNLRSFNLAGLGLFFGFLFGKALVLVLGAILQISAPSIQIDATTLEILQITLFLFGVYMGTVFTLRAADEIHISIPFVRFAPQTQKRKDLLADLPLLCDARIVDLASSGLVDHQLIIPKFVTKELYELAESPEEASRHRGKRGLDVLKRLSSLPEFGLRHSDTDFPEVKDPLIKLLRLARLLDANILSGDTKSMQIPSAEGVKIVHLSALSNALKPLMQTGENIKIKIQRHGKEPRQGVGYLEDGSMVVVNGGGEFLGETIEVRVLSVKHTSSGRIVFCNALDAEGHYPIDEGTET